MTLRTSATSLLSRRLRAALPAALLALSVGAMTATPALAGDPVVDFTTDSAGNANPTPINNLQPSLGLNYFVPRVGVFPSPSRGGGAGGYLGQIRMFAGNFTPGGAVAAEGQLLAVSQNDALFSIYGTIYGGDGETTLAVPDLAGRASVHYGQGPGLSNWNIGQERGSATTTLAANNIPIHNHTFSHPDSPTGNTGGGQAISNFQPTLATNFWIATQGVFPSQNRIGGGTEPFLGQILQFGGNFESPGFMEANGQILPINQNTALFALLGTTYGGDGESNFALPDLRGRVAVHAGTGTGPGVSHWSLGEQRGVESNALGVNNMPGHSHALPELGIDSNNTGGGAPIDISQPGLGINFIIALDGHSPTDDSSASVTPLLGEVSMFAGAFAPRDWAFLDGQLLLIEQHEALFSILGTTYGGDGEITFALPDLRGRTPVHADGILVDLGELLGTEQVTLTESNLPEHDHTYVPEPTSAALLGLAGLALLRRRR